MAIDVVALNAEVERLQAEARRLEWRSYHVAVALVAGFGALQVLGWEIPRTLWALALLGLGNAATGVSTAIRSRPRLNMALSRASIVAGSALLLLILWQLLWRIAT